MLPSEIDFIRHCLPKTMPFPYFADRESPWLLARQMHAPSKVALLRAGTLGKLLDRPAVRPVVAVCGGILDPADLRAVASAGSAIASANMSAPALAGLEAAYALPWHDFELSYAAWGIEESYGYAQMSRPGGNLVIQMGFPSDHASLMGRYLKRDQRKAYEYSLHPVRRTGRPTLAWARVDIDLDRGVALIEEVQTDWLRFVREEVDDLERVVPRSRELRVARAYEAQLRDRYGKIWPRAILLAALTLLVEDLGCHDIWMHRPGPGAVLKGIQGSHPPRSLYTALPKAMGFSADTGLPPMLAAEGRKRQSRARQRALARWKDAGAPLFWRLAL